jgi:hypothetical protein
MKSSQNGGTSIRKYAEQNVQAAGKFEPGPEQDKDVLHVSLAPAPVPGQHGWQMWRGLFVTAFEVIGQPDFIPRSPHERRLDSVVTENPAFQGTTPAQLGQSAEFYKRGHSQDGVMAPIISSAQMPKTGAGREKGTVQPARELLYPAKEGLPEDEPWRALDNSDRGIVLHDPNEPDDQFSGHDAVGIRHDHVTVSSAPPPAKVSNVPAFVVKRDPPFAVENFAKRVQLLAKREPRLFLLDPVIRIVRIA